jgi:transcriptional regulator with XRE-family HTH domain
VKAPTPDPRQPYERLRERMAELDVSAAALAAALGIAKGNVTDWLADKRVIPTDRVAQAAAELGLSARWLALGEGDRHASAVTLTLAGRRLVELRRKSAKKAAELKALRAEIRTRELEQAQALDAAEVAAFHRGET